MKRGKPHIVLTDRLGKEKLQRKSICLSKYSRLHTPATIKKVRTILKSSTYYKVWERMYMIQKDLRTGMSYRAIEVKYGISHPTVSRAKNCTIPDDVKVLIDNPGLKSFSDVTSHTQEKVRAEQTNLNALQFVEDPDYLNIKMFSMQRLILKAFYGIPLDKDKPCPEFHGCTEQAMMDLLIKDGKCTWKGQKEYRELVLVIGMKGGKTALGGMIACVEEYSLYKLPDCRAHYGLPKGKKILILNVASNADQSQKTVFAEIESIVKTAPYYARRPVPDMNSNRIFFEEQNVLVQSGHSNSDALVGPLSKIVLLDELDRFTNKGAGKAAGKASGNRMYSSISRNVTPFKNDGKIVSMSSSMMESGPIIRLFNMSKNEPSMLGFRLATWEMNPNLPFECETLQIELRKSPEDFWRDYGVKPAHSIAKYYRDRDKLEQVFMRAESLGVKNPIHADGTFADWFKGNPDFNYHMHFDPSAKNDVFGFAMAHRDGAYIKADLVHEFKAVDKGEVDYLLVREFIMRIIERFPTVTTATYDVYLAIELMQSLRAKGVEATFLRIDKKEHDIMKIEAVYNGRLVCYPYDKLRMELRALDLLNGRKVDHASQLEDSTPGSKDIADSLAGAVCACVAEGDFTVAAAACGGGEGSQELQSEGSKFNRQPGMTFGTMSGGSSFGGGDGPGSGRGGGLIW